jgi:hypothetical protein
MSDVDPSRMMKDKGSDRPTVTPLRNTLTFKDRICLCFGDPRSGVAEATSPGV